MTPDRLSGSIGDPGSLNKYAYVGGDPTNRFDPNGNETVCTGPADDRSCHWYPDIVDYGWAPGYYPPDFDGWIDYGPGRIDPCLYLDCGGTEAQTTSTPTFGNQDFSTAQQSLHALSLEVGDLFQGQLSPSCYSDLAALGVTAFAVSEAGYNATFLNGMTSIANYADTIWGGTPLAGAARGQFNHMTIAQYMASPQPMMVIDGAFVVSNVVATGVSTPGGSTTYINAGLVNGMSSQDQMAFVLHELIHHVTGKVDDAIQRALGLPTNVPSRNISTMLGQDCLPAR